MLKRVVGTWAALAATMLAVDFAATAAAAQPPGAKDGVAASGKAAAPVATATAAPVRYRPDRFAGRAWKHYQLIWGVDSLSVRLAESGEIVRFTYRVLDPDKAKPLNDKRNEPSLIDPRAGVKLVVPTMEKIGQLRPSGAPEAGKAYWMAFSNKGRPVKKGDHVDVVIGPFRAQGLVVD
jgi:hypothetical protein